MKGIIGIGNAITDVLMLIPNEDILFELGFIKGSMQLVDWTTIQFLKNKLKPYIRQIKSGGSAGNTIYGIASMGVPSSFVGKTANDKIGSLYKSDLQQQGVKTHFGTSQIPSGMAIAMITPDSERTFATYLGAAAELSPNDINEKWLDDYSIIHIEGYLIYNEPLITHIAELAKKHQLLISFDMASFNVVQEKKVFLETFLEKYVDIVFSNEEEAYAFCGKQPEESAEILASYCNIAIVKRGKLGSIVVAGQQKYTISAISSNVIDTTGAGDWYASGFLFGLYQQYELERCGRIASFLAGKVIEHIGAKIPNDLLPEVINMAKKL